MYQTIMMAELEAKLKKQTPFILDVREVEEFVDGHIPGALNTPVSQFITHLATLEKQTSYFIVCHSGSRSAMVAEFLGKQGYRATNVLGGMTAYRGKLAFGKK